MRAGVDQSRNPPDHVAPGDLEHHSIRQSSLRLFQRTKPEPVEQVPVVGKCAAVDSRHSPALNIVALQIEDASGAASRMGFIGSCRHLPDEQDFPFDGIRDQMSLPRGK